MTPPDATRSTGTPQAPLILVTLATALALIVFTAPLTTLEAMTASLGLTAAQQAWVMSAMPLGCAAGLLSAGALGDTHGRRATFTAGLWLTVLASAAAALAPTGTTLILARIAQGLGSAGIMACGLGLLGQVYAGAERRRAAAIWAAGLGAGVATGPVLASAAMEAGGWQAIHWLLGAGAAALAVLSARLPESAPRGSRVDLPGSLLLMAGLGCLLSALTELRAGGGTAGVLAAAGAVLTAAFLAFETRIPNPILRLDLFRRRDFSGATLAAFASGAGVLALMSMVPTVLVRGTGLAPLSSALVLIAWSGLTVVSALGARLLPEMLDARDRAVLGLAGCLGAQLLMLLPAEGTGWIAVLPGLVAAGIANGILNAALGHAAVESVPPESAAMGSAANNTARYLGSAIGIALISLLLAGNGAGHVFDGWHRAVLASSGFTLAGIAAMLLLGRGPVAAGQ
ncbi:MFS transporter [Poseidonocella sp. HB161398]|uniref:MFS transporter n=1 Tax=Poseidonocella sp. HB161398 TaxID=2320855 RepID=UPI00148617AA|nr:MFS transporter [Poseidonocella sp. HB161398]